MNTRRVVVIAAISAVAGLLVGAFGASWYWLEFNASLMSYGLLVRTQAEIISKVSVLEHLRAGRAEDATKLLETYLDGDLIGAGTLAREGHELNANARRAVALELRARELSGYEPSEPTVRAAVEEAFSLVPERVDGSGVQPDPGEVPRAARP